MRKYAYTDPDAHGYLMEAKACKKVVREINRLADKYLRAINREKATKKAELEAVMQYKSEEDIQNDYGWDFLTEAQYDRYIELFRTGKDALENGPPTVNELVLNILRLISSDIYSEQREWEFSALTPKQQAEERKRAEENRAAWKKRIAEIKAERSDADR